MWSKYQIDLIINEFVAAIRKIIKKVKKEKKKSNNNYIYLLPTFSSCTT